MTATKNQSSAETGSSMETASAYAPPSSTAPSSARTQLALGGFSPALSLRRSSKGFVKWIWRRELSRISRWMTPKIASVSRMAGTSMRRR